MMPRNPPWRREELILALDLYFRIGLASDQDEAVDELSHLLNRLNLHRNAPDPETFRNSNGVRMKLGNFAALDPAYPGVGLQSGGKLDAKIWDEFAYDREGLEREAQAIREAAVPVDPPASGTTTRHYWAYLANPSIYRIEGALSHVRLDWWPTEGRPVAVDDRVVIWRAQDRPRDLRRGVVALGEVVGGPENRSDAANPFWAVPPPDVPEERVQVRYVVPPNLPLWLDGPADEVLRDLSVSRGQGTIFNVTPQQWDAIVAAAGGWHDEAPEVKEALDLIDEVAGKQTSGQRFQSSAEARLAIERYAMERAASYYRAQGWRVEDVSATNPYDLRCTRDDGREIRDEVKGTTGDGSQVLLTRGEVEHARAHASHVALFVLAGIGLVDGPDHLPQGSGGQQKVYEPWVLNDEALSPVGYTYWLRS